MRSKRRLGHAFLDRVVKVTPKLSNRSGRVRENSWEDSLISNFHDNYRTEQTSPWVKVSLLVVFLITFFGLFLRIFHLQIVEGNKWRSLADSNRIKIKVIHAPRGVIYDRNGKILAQNEPAFRLVEPDASSSTKVKIERISRDQALQMEVGNDPRFKDLEIDGIRSYPYKEAMAHVLGYMGEITGPELKDPNYQDYKPGDQIGRSGIEQIYEKTLRGVDGGEIVEVDSEGNEIQSLRKTDPIPGQNVYLSIDADLQQEVYKDLADGVKKAGSCCGAAVAEDPNNGQILALASYPSFDPKNITPALINPDAPLLDRAISGTYPPGSTFKIASALAGLVSGKITPRTTYQDTGIMNLGPFTFANWYYTEYGRKEQGPVDIVRAIQRSNDIFFYQLGAAAGEGSLGQTAEKLGLGNILGIDLPGEAKGLIPDDAWKEKNIGVAWYPGDTLHMVIGQGYVLATPLQILNLTSAIAADGKQYPPHLALKITNPDNNFTIKRYSFSNVSTAKFDEKYLSLVRQGMEEVPKNGGTAWPFFNFTIPTAGKTGTAEFGDPKNRTHAWYTSYAPAQNPKIAMTVLVEAGGEGSNVSAPIAKQVYTWYFSKDKTHLTNFDAAPVATASAKTLGE